VSSIRIQRPHQLGLEAARKIAFAWAEKAERKFDMECLYTEGKDGDTLSFQRSGVQGTLQVLPESFELEARLGLLVSAFKDQIASELNAQFDSLLAQAPAKKAKPKAKSSAKADDAPAAKAAKPEKAAKATKAAKEPKAKSSKA
jgi:putative polyhydroxyalkanoate system protein